MTQRALAETARVAVSYLSEIETGKKPGSFAAMQRIAGALEVPVGDISNLMT
jgi:transcriptional regulator with XRE-family HTH domain